MITQQKRLETVLAALAVTALALSGLSEARRSVDAHLSTAAALLGFDTPDNLAQEDAARPAEMQADSDRDEQIRFPVEIAI